MIKVIPSHATIANQTLILVLIGSYYYAADVSLLSVVFFEQPQIVDLFTEIGSVSCAAVHLIDQVILDNSFLSFMDSCLLWFYHQRKYTAMECQLSLDHIIHNPSKGYCPIYEQLHRLKLRHFAEKCFVQHLKLCLNKMTNCVIKIDYCYPKGIF